MLQATQLLGIYLIHAHNIIMFSLKTSVFLKKKINKIKTSVFLWKLKKLSLYQNEKKYRKKIIKGEKAWFRGENRVLNVHLFEHA